MCQHDDSTGSSKERRAALEQNFARDAVLVHPFFVVYGRDAIYWIYEVCTCSLIALQAASCAAGVFSNIL